MIRLTDLRRKFGKLQVLDGLSLEVKPGEIYGFLGRNGAGKTTTLRMLMGILRPQSGQIELFGAPVDRVTVAHKQRIGFVSQEQTFYPWMNARELGRFVSGFYPSWDPVEFERLLMALDVPADRRASELSGGTRAKLGLCLAFAPRPALVLLDEPTAGLDPVARREFNELLVQVVKAGGATAFFSSHLVDEVELIANRVGIIQHGRLRFEGDITALLAAVRRLTLPEGSAVPEGFTQIRNDVYRAEPELWNATVWPEGTAVTSLDLEDAFLAYARTA